MSLPHLKRKVMIKTRRFNIHSHTRYINDIPTYIFIFIFIHSPPKGPRIQTPVKQDLSRQKEAKRSNRGLPAERSSQGPVTTSHHYLLYLRSRSPNSLRTRTPRRSEYMSHPQNSRQRQTSPTSSTNKALWSSRFVRLKLPAGTEDRWIHRGIRRI